MLDCITPPKKISENNVESRLKSGNHVSSVIFDDFKNKRTGFFFSKIELTALEYACLSAMNTFNAFSWSKTD